jgi:hypothetical protein
MDRKPVEVAYSDRVYLRHWDGRMEVLYYLPGHWFAKKKQRKEK